MVTWSLIPHHCRCFLFPHSSLISVQDANSQTLEGGKLHKYFRQQRYLASLGLECLMSSSFTGCFFSPAGWKSLWPWPFLSWEAKSGGGGRPGSGGQVQEGAGSHSCHWGLWEDMIVCTGTSWLRESQGPAYPEAQGSHCWEKTLKKGRG